jgi:hypothetical protein
MTQPISGSELDAFAKCRMYHYYSFGLNLEAVEARRALDIGTAGHALLAAYYRARQSGASHNEAVAQTEGMAAWETQALAGVSGEAADFALQLVRMYWAFYPRDDWEILQVEAEYRNGPYACTVDLVVQEDNEIAIVDHRFLGRFYDEDLVAIDQQLPRYALIMRANGVPVTRAYRNMISTASLGSKGKRVIRLPVPVNEARLEQARKEREQLAMELTRWRPLPADFRRLYSPRTFSPQVCKFCDFKVPCALSAEGLDDQPVLDQQFRKNVRYGYAPESPID